MKAELFKKQLLDQTKEDYGMCRPPGTRELALKVKRSKELQEKIKNILSSDTLEITEHAMVRYFERVCGYDLEVIKQGIVSQELKAKAMALGTNFETQCDGYTVVVKNSRIVTIK
jgi:hypothetical protein